MASIQEGMQPRTIIIGDPDSSPRDPSPDTASTQSIMQLQNLAPAEQNSPKLGFISLPPELRVKIYRHLLVGYSTVTNNQRPCTYGERLSRMPSTLSMNPRFGFFGLSIQSICICSRQLSECPCSTQLSPAILRTCKVVYKEAADVLYTENKFNLGKRTGCRQAWEVSRFFMQIGPARTSTIRELNLSIITESPGSEELWLRIMKQLIPSVTGLKTLRIRFPSQVESTLLYSSDYDIPDVRPGLGFEPRIAKLLSSIGQLETMQLSGDFDKDWLGYFARRLPHCRIVHLIRSRNLRPT